MAEAIAQVVGFLLVCMAAGAVASSFPPRAREWYAALKKPPWTPPDRAFGPVWAILYLVMGFSAWLVWRHAGWEGAPAALLLFFVQLVFNVLWAALFFGMRSPAAALVEISVLWVMIAATAAAFWPVSPAAALMLVPYLAWISFLAALTLSVWRMNRAAPTTPR